MLYEDGCMVTSVGANMRRKYTVNTGYIMNKLCEIGGKGGVDMWNKQEDGIM
jgi:hypothetical protein